MNITILKYQASVFVDAGSITANSQDVTELLRMLEDKRLLPIAVKQHSPAGFIDRIGFQSSDAEWRLVLLTDRFDFVHERTQKSGEDLGRFSDFCEEAITKLGMVLEYFGRRAHRVAAVQEGMLPEMSSGTMNEVMTRLLRLPPTFSDNSPFEWDWRSACLIERSFGGITEPMNTLVTIKRRAAQLTEATDDGIKRIPVDRVFFEIDINTSPRNTKARFAVRETREFFRNAPTWHLDIKEDVLRFIGGEVQNV